MPAWKRPQLQPCSWHKFGYARGPVPAFRVSSNSGFLAKAGLVQTLVQRALSDPERRKWGWLQSRKDVAEEMRGGDGAPEGNQFDSVPGPSLTTPSKGHMHSKKDTHIHPAPSPSAGRNKNSLACATVANRCHYLIMFNDFKVCIMNSRLPTSCTSRQRQPSYFSPVYLEKGISKAQWL